MLFSPVFRFLMKKKPIYTEIDTEVREYFKKLPEIKFYRECYHEKNCTESEISDLSGSSTENDVTIHKETLKFPYYSVRDISGLFLLNAEKAKKTPKVYIKLIINTEIYFADTISYFDYISQKEAFRKKNIDQDVKINFKATKTIPGLVKESNVKINGHEPDCISSCLYLLLTLLMFGQFYKSYLNRCFITRRLTIRKLISTRYNLMNEENSQKYSSFNPRLKIFDQEYTYEPEDIGYVNEANKIETPTEKELHEAQEYLHNMPNFHF